MGRGFLLRYLAAASGFVVLATFAAPPVAAAGNAHLHLQKTVDPTQVAINPNIAVTLAVDKATAIPGDTLTYTAVVTNPTATMGMGGNIDAQTDPNSDAVVAYYWDELEVCATGCGNGQGNPHWSAVATFENSQSGYQPVQPPALHTGMSFAAQPVTRSGVVYPTSGDMILGTQISAASTATWTYAARIVLSPAQIAMLADPAQVSAMRNVIHFEVTPRNSNAAQPFTDLELFTNPFTTAANPGAISNVTVAFTLPDGTTTAVNPTSSLAPGASATATAKFKVPVPAAHDPSIETDSDYLLRLAKLNGAVLTAKAVASGAGFSGTVYASSLPVSTNEFVPIVLITKTGPPTVDAGATETNPLSVQNVGGAAASSLAIVDRVPASPNGTVTGTPASLAANAVGSATATYAVPASQAEGSLTDTASVTWLDANSNPYGPVSSAFTTTVHNILFGAALTLAPVTAGPNPPGTSQVLTATLVDRHGNPIPNQVVTFTVTGANTATGTGTTDASGHAVFSYTGANSGNDIAIARVSTAAITLSSNTSAISWGKPLQPVATTQVQGNFYPNPSNSCAFAASGTPAFGQSFPDILFNADPSVVPHDISSVGPSTRPFTDKTVDVNGNFNGLIVAQGNGLQAGSGTLGNFFAVFTGNFIVNQAGDVTFTVIHDDSYILGVGNGATRVNGDLEGNPPATTPFNNYGVVAAFNLPGNGTGSDTVHFPAPGTYPYELDYTECGGGGLQLVLETAKFIPQTDALSIYVGYADGLRAGGSLFPFPWQGSPGVTFIGGCTFDAGALRFDNSGSTDITLDKVTVDLGTGGPHFDLWGPNPLVVPAHGILILTQTGCFNFDTSDFSNAGCGGNNGVLPLVNLTRGGVVKTYTDTGQILNTRGFDLVCQGNESTPWQRIAGQASTVNVPLPPAVMLDLMPFNIPTAVQGQSVSVTVSALDAAGNPQVNLPVGLHITGANAQNLTATTNTAGLATFSYAGNLAGTDSLQATAFPGGAQAISNQGKVIWSPPGGTSNPLGATITNVTPADGAIVTKPVTIGAAIAPPSGQSIASWRVFYQALDPGPQVVIASGSGTPPSTLATFDPTTLVNDTYAITVEATASGGAVQDVSTTVTVLGNLKPGRFTFAFQDLSVPVSGFSMEVRRSYDSFDKSTGDFGVGWRVSVVNFRTAANHQLGAGGWTMYDKQCFFGLCTTAYTNSGPRFVSVVFPDQHVELFKFTPDGGTNVFWSCTPLFTAEGDQGTTSTLVPFDDTSCSYRGDGNLYGSSGVYNPQRFKLTTRDGQVLILDTHLGLISETDTHGNALTIDAAGVHATAGGSITFTRDSAGRITKITGPSGETLGYTYSTAGDLASVTDPRGAVTTFAYDSAHNLTSTTGPGGQPLAAATYDSNGRLTSITDATGKTVQISSDVPGQKEIITDPAGETFVATLSDRGDLLSQAEVADGHANTYTFTYDSVGRQLTATDPLGNTSRLTYDTAGDLLSSTDPQGRRSTMTYGPNGELLTFTDPAGGVTTYAYDAALNLISVTDAAGATTTYTYDSAGNRTSERNALGAVTSYTYDSGGRVLTRTDALGRTTTNTYDSSGRLLTSTDAAANRTSGTYDAAGLPVSMTDPTGAVTRYIHDALGRVTSVTDPLGRVTAYSYDGDGRVTAKTDPLGGKTTYTYDADGRVLTETDPAGGVLTYAYDGHGRAVTLTDAVGRVTHRGYDDAGNLVSETNPAGGVTRYAYGSDGLKTSVTDPLGRATTFTYDSVGRLNSRTNSLGQKTAYAYDAMGRQTSITDALGASTKYTYDAAGQRLTETDATGGVTVYRYDLAGQQTAITDPTGRTTTLTYDAAGNRASATDAGGHTTAYTYDAAGRQTQVTTALGRSTSFAYNSAGELVVKTDALGNMTHYGYDAGGRMTTGTSPRGAVTTTAYDAAGRPVKITDALGGTVSLAYDAAGELVSSTDPDGHATTFTYGSLGKLSSRTFPWGGVQTYAYDAAGQLTTQANARGTTATYSYDAGGHTVQVSVTGGSYTQAFDAAGRRTTFTDATGTTNFTYDASGRPTSVASPAGTIGYTYDLAGRRTSESLPGGRTISYTYDGAGLIASTRDWVGGTIAFSHDADGEITSISRPGSSTSMTYDAAGRTTSITHQSGAVKIDSFSYTYDADGNRTSVALNAGTESYTLDLAGRLTGVTYPDGTSASYAYDAAANRTTLTTGGSTTSYTYDSSGRLISAGSTAITYDADGNQVSKGTDRFAYDWAGRLTSATVGGILNTFTYNADGARVAEARAGVTAGNLVDETGALPQLIGDGTNTYVRDPSGSLLEWVSQTGAVTSPLADALGSVRYQTGATGTVTGSASYDVYGAVRSQTGATSPFGFTGEQADPTGLLYLRARYDDPTLGRFLSPDSLDNSGHATVGYNRYVYAADDPTSLTDPSGHLALEWERIYLAVAVIGALGLYAIGRIIIATLEQSCIYRGNCWSAPAIPWSGSTAVAPAARQPTGKTLDKQRIINATKTAVVACAAVGAFGAFTGFGATNPCNRLPINVFYIGLLDLFEATQHDLGAIKNHPFDWELLHKASNPLTTTVRKWYNSDSRCTPDKYPSNPGKDCDEYPFYTTEEGGPAGPPDNLGADLEFIDSWQNRTQGSRLNGFYTRCHMQNGDSFVVFPTGVTYGICKGA